MSSIAILVCNLIAWFWPGFLLRSTVKWSYLVIAFFFSQSYYFLPLFYKLFNLDFSVVVISSHVETILYYSLFAGVVYSFFFYAFIRKANEKQTEIAIADWLFIRTKKYIPRIEAVPILAVFLIFVTWICIFLISEYSYVGSRNIWVRMQEHRAWLRYRDVLGVLIGFVFFASSHFANSRAARWVVFLNFLLLFSFVLLMGFDGARRQIVLPMIGFFYMAVAVYQDNKKLGKHALLYFLFSVLLLSFFALSRGYGVGWSVIYHLDRLEFSRWLLSLLVPMSTLHVNTHMVDYVQTYGYQGASSYFSALINTLFPNFVFGKYYGGTPLVTRLHQELGWFGFDFGLLAEAIYGGGVKYIFAVHSCLASYHAILLHRISQGRLIAIAFFVSFHIAVIQGLRSDFMNFIKWATYPAIALLFVFLIYRVLKFLTFRLR